MEITKNDLNKTVWAKKDYTDKTRKWYRIDATGITLGKLAEVVAKKLQGKHKAFYNDFWDTGDFVVVENFKNMKVTGKKMSDKMYYSHSGYKGHLKSITLGNLLVKNPEKVLWFAVRGMLPKNKLRDSRMKRLKVFVETSTMYDHLSPETIKIND